MNESFQDWRKIMEKNFDMNSFIEKYEKEEKERLKRISENLNKNPMCETCSQAFPGCCACDNI